MTFNRLLFCSLKAIAVSIILAMPAWGAAQEFVLHTFSGGADGNRPSGRLVSDAAGNLFGTATGGGDFGKGVVFKLTRTGSTWNYSVIYSFHGPDGYFPVGQLALDGAGNFYGTTALGGDYGGGTVYQLSLTPSSFWRVTVLHSFTGGKDGASPQSGVTLDSSGNLYGTTFLSGNLAACFSQGCGTVYKLKPVPTKPWKFIVLHTFQGGNDGSNPQAGITLDSAGNLYGTTMGSGQYGFGTAYQLSPGPHTFNQGRFRLLHAFRLSDGITPAAGLTFDSSGNAYGVALTGGSTDSSNGTIFQLIPKPVGRWNFKLLYEFTGDNMGGVQNDLLLDSNGNIYGTGGVGSGTGIFELSPRGDGTWLWNVVYAFNGADGADAAGVILGADGHFYGATTYGGAAGDGVVFEIAP